MRGEPQGSFYQSASGESFPQRICPSPSRDGGALRAGRGSMVGLGWKTSQTGGAV